MWGFYFSSMLEDFSCFLFYFIRADFMLLLMAWVREDSAVFQLCSSSRELNCLWFIAWVLKGVVLFIILVFPIEGVAKIYSSSMEDWALKHWKGAEWWWVAGWWVAEMAYWVSKG